MDFYLIYKSLIHPGYRGYVTAFTLEERLLHIKEAQRTLPTTIPWLTDDMDDRLSKAVSEHPNSEWILGPDGEILVKRAWSDPKQLRKDLIELVGPVENPTRPEDIDLKLERAPVEAKPLRKLKCPAGSKPLEVRPLGDGPFYVKPRVEASPGLLKKGEGKLWVQLRNDPVYRVHWNNLAGPIRVHFEGEGVSLNGKSYTGEKPETEWDDAPREFLFDVSWPDASKELKLLLDCWICDDKNTWCKAFRYEYVMTRKQDKQGGWRLKGILKKLINLKDSRDGSGK